MNQEAKVKIFIEAHCFDNEFQGTRTFIKELYTQLFKLSDSLEFYFGATNIDNLKREFDSLAGVHFIQYKSTSSILRNYFEIPAILKKNGIDVAHFQYISPFRKHCNYIVTTHDILFNDFKSEFSFLYRFSRNFLFKYSIKHAAMKTTVSEYSRERIDLHYHLNKDQISVIPNGVNEKFFAPFNRTEAREYVSKKYGISKFILYVSRIEPRKNNALLLETYLASKLYEKNVQLVFIGKTSIRYKTLDNAIAAMPEEARKKFFYIEQMNEEDLIKFYQAAEVFVYPSKAEGFGIPPLEAAALRTPVLCSNKTAMSDYTFFGDNLFDPENKEELAVKLDKILSGKDSANYDVISEQIKLKYDWKTSAENLFSLIKKLYPKL